MTTRSIYLYGSATVVKVERYHVNCITATDISKRDINAQIHVRVLKLKQEEVLGMSTIYDTQIAWSSRVKDLSPETINLILQNVSKAAEFNLDRGSMRRVWALVQPLLKHLQSKGGGPHADTNHQTKDAGHGSSDVPPAR